MNALGRYDVQGDTVVTHADVLGTFTPPATLAALEDEIARVLADK